MNYRLQSFGHTANMVSLFLPVTFACGLFIAAAHVRSDALSPHPCCSIIRFPRCSPLSRSSVGSSWLGGQSATAAEAIQGSDLRDRRRYWFSLKFG